MFCHVAIYSVKFILALLIYYMKTLFLCWLLRLKNQLFSLSHILSPTEHILDGMNLLSHSSQKRSIDFLCEIILVVHKVVSFMVRRSARKAYHEKVDSFLKRKKQIKGIKIDESY